MSVEESNTFILEDENRATAVRHRKFKVTSDVVFKCLIVLGSFIIYFVADGVSLSSGIILRESRIYFKATTTQSSITASLLQSIPLFLSPIVCILIEKFSCRTVTCVGAGLVTLSFVVTRFFVNDILSLYVTLGCLCSVGLAMCYIPAYLILSFYFDKKRALAIGIAVSGSGIGVFAMPPIMEMLINEFGWMSACLVIGGISSHMLISGCLFRPLNKKDQNAAAAKLKLEESKPKVSFAKKACLVLKSLYCNKMYLTVNLAYTLLSFLGTAPYNFLPDFVDINSIHDKYSLSISLIGVATVVGQLVFGFIADKLLHLNWLIYSSCLITAGLATCILPLLKNLYLICIYSVIFGFTTSVNYVLQSNLVIEAVGIENLTYAFGCIQLMQGISTLLGTPTVAWLKDLTGNYNVTFFTSGAFIGLSGVCLLLWPLVRPKKELIRNKQ